MREQYEQNAFRGKPRLLLRKQGTFILTKEHTARFLEIEKELKKLKNVSFSKAVYGMALAVSKKDRVVIWESKGNLCTIAIYVTGSNIRWNIDCNSLNQKQFKKDLIQLRRREKLEHT